MSFAQFELRLAADGGSAAARGVYQRASNALRHSEEKEERLMLLEVMDLGTCYSAGPLARSCNVLIFVHVDSILGGIEAEWSSTNIFRRCSLPRLCVTSGECRWGRCGAMVFRKHYCLAESRFQISVFGSCVIKVDTR